MSPTTIRQWITAQDGLDNIKLGETEKPTAGDGEVLVKVNAVALNYRDTEVAMGLYGHHASVKQEEIVLGSDICGMIEVSNSARWKTGQRAMAIFNQTHLTGQIKAKDMSSGLGLPLPGCLTEYRVFPADGLVEVPSYLSDEEAACLPIAAVTAWMSINGFQPLDHSSHSSDETILIQGTGGVAISGLQIAHAAGMKTIVTSSSDDKLKKAKALGADHGVNYGSMPDWDQEVMRLTSDNGADIILENGGAQTLRKSFECVAFGGLINCIGYLSGKEEISLDRTHTNVLALKRNVTLKGILNGPRDRFEEMVRFYEKHEIRPVIDRIVKFEEAQEALKYLFSGSHFGKVVVKVTG